MTVILGLITIDHTIGQSGYSAEVSQYYGLGEQYFMRSLHTISVTLHYSSHNQSPSPSTAYASSLDIPRLCLKCNRQLAIFTFTKRFFCKTGSNRIFFLIKVLFFSVSQPDSPIMGVSDIGQVSTYV